MNNVYLAKSDLTGAVYVVHGRTKTDVTGFVTDLIKLETASIKAALAELVEAARAKELFELRNYDLEMPKDAAEYAELSARQDRALANAKSFLD